MGFMGFFDFLKPKPEQIIEKYYKDYPRLARVGGTIVLKRIEKSIPKNGIRTLIYKA